jgi:hypothetical protein
MHTRVEVVDDERTLVTSSGGASMRKIRDHGPGRRVGPPPLANVCVPVEDLVASNDLAPRCPKRATDRKTLHDALGRGSVAQFRAL